MCHFSNSKLWIKICSEWSNNSVSDNSFPSQLHNHVVQSLLNNLSITLVPNINYTSRTHAASSNIVVNINIYPHDENSAMWGFPILPISRLLHMAVNPVLSCGSIGVCVWRAAKFSFCILYSAGSRSHIVVAMDQYYKILEHVWHETSCEVNCCYERCYLLAIWRYLGTCLWHMFVWVNPLIYWIQFVKHKAW